MEIRISELQEKFKSKSEVSKWLDGLKEKLTKQAYENRNEVNKRELRWELDRLDALCNLWNKFLELRKQNPLFDMVFRINARSSIRSQYIEYPYTDEEWEKMRALKTSYCYMGECAREVLGERVESLFPMLEIYRGHVWGKADGKQALEIDFGER